MGNRGLTSATSGGAGSGPAGGLIVVLLLLLSGASGCYRVNTPRAARAALPRASDAPAAVPADDLPADAVPRQEYKTRLGNPAFYEEFGVRYRVLDTSRDFVEEGLASWYGRDFHGRRTSSGDPYDMFAMTAAHKTLPLPTYVRVTDLDTGNRVVVRVNDRGPFVEGRVIDLSYVAALKLGIAARGTARVEVRALDPPALDPPGLEGWARGVEMWLWADGAPGSCGAGGAGWPGAGGALEGRPLPYRPQTVKGCSTRLEFR